MNKLETQLETTSHLYKPLKIRSDLDLSWLNNSNKNNKLVDASRSGLLIETTPPQAINHWQ